MIYQGGIILKEIGIILKDGLILKTLINIDGDLFIKTTGQEISLTFIINF